MYTPMKAQTLMLTVICEYCGTPKTYKSIETKQIGNATGHIHKLCKIARNQNLQHRKNNLM
jgi:hypothetical protein